jgi:hypothetical protein
VKASAVSGIALGALAVACGTVLASSDDGKPPGGEASVDAGATNDDATVTGEGGSSSAEASASVSAPIVRACPTGECPQENTTLGEKCTDDACSDDLDWNPTGLVTTSDGSCVASGAAGTDAFIDNDANRSGPTMSVALSFDVRSWSIAGRTIARVGIFRKEVDERFEAVVKNGQLVLCERGPAGEKCTTGVPFPAAGRAHLFGLLSSENPPRGSFALSLDGCDAPAQVLPVTAPFPDGLVDGAVGCLPGLGDCSITFDNVDLFTRPE